MASDHVIDLLTDINTRVEDLLRADNILEELADLSKSEIHISLLSKFFNSVDTIEQLLNSILYTPSDTLKYEEKFMFPYVAYNILTMGIDKINSMIVNECPGKAVMNKANEDSMQFAFNIEISPISGEEETKYMLMKKIIKGLSDSNTTIEGYICGILNQISTSKAEEIIQYFMTERDYGIDFIFSHIKFHSIHKFIMNILLQKSKLSPHIIDLLQLYIQQGPIKEMAFQILLDYSVHSPNEIDEVKLYYRLEKLLNQNPLSKCVGFYIRILRNYCNSQSIIKISRIANMLFIKAYHGKSKILIEILEYIECSLEHTLHLNTKIANALLCLINKKRNASVIHGIIIRVFKKALLVDPFHFYKESNIVLFLANYPSELQSNSVWFIEIYRLWASLGEKGKCKEPRLQEMILWADNFIASSVPDKVNQEIGDVKQIALD